MAYEYMDFPLEVKSADIKKDGTFEGWGSLFDNEPDAHNDVVARGAFTETLAAGGRNKTGIAMLWQHRPDKIPGIWVALAEHPKGLRVVGKLALETQLGREIYELLKLGVKLGLSIGFDTQDFSYHTPKGGNRKIRILKKISLWECSLCTFPAKLGAGVQSVKTALTIRSLEESLRDSGLSKSAAQYVISICRPSLKEPAKVGSKSEWSEILNSLKAINKNLETHA